MPKRGYSLQFFMKMISTIFPEDKMLRLHLYVEESDLGVWPRMDQQVPRITVPEDAQKMIFPPHNWISMELKTLALHCHQEEVHKQVILIWVTLIFLCMDFWQAALGSPLTQKQGRVHPAWRCFKAVHSHRSHLLLYRMRNQQFCSLCCIKCREWKMV